MTDLAKFLSGTEDKNPTQTSLKHKGTLPLHMIKSCAESSCFNKFIRTLFLSLYVLTLFPSTCSIV